MAELKIFETKHYTADGKLKWIVEPRDDRTDELKDAICLGEFIELGDKDAWREIGYHIIKDRNTELFYAQKIGELVKEDCEKETTKEHSGFTERVSSYAWNGDNV